MSHYLVTGGAGFIGSNLVKRLIKDGHKVRVLDNFSAGRFPDRIQSGVEYIEGDICNMEDLEKAVEAIDSIFHTAAKNKVPYSLEHPQETNENNIVGTLNVLVAAKKAGLKKVIYSSSSSAYGNQTASLFCENQCPKPISPYGLQKFVGEEYCRIYSNCFDLPTISLRYFNVYGPHLDPNGVYSAVVGKFLLQKKNNQPLTVYGNGNYYRDFTHVNDVVDANILAMQTTNINKSEVINIGGGNPHSILELVGLIGGTIEYLPERKGDIQWSGANINKAKKLIGWEPKIKLSDGIADLKKSWIDWLRNCWQ